MNRPTPPDLSAIPPIYHESSVRTAPHPCHHTTAMTAPSTFSPAPVLPVVGIYSLSTPERLAMEKYIGESLPARFIHPSSSPAGAGFFFVGKKDGSLRPYIDNWGLNNIPIKNRYPIPLISSAFTALQKAQYFTKLYLWNAYHLIRIREGDEWKTAFNTPRGHYEYRVMPLGLTNAPAVFQALINDVLRDVINRHVFIYLDDILIFSETIDQHICYVAGEPPLRQSREVRVPPVHHPVPKGSWSPRGDWRWIPLRRKP